jgi:DNA-binding response OmpR family regulator
MRLFLVEDELDLGISIHHALTKRNCIVDLVEDGETASYRNVVILKLLKLFAVWVIAFVDNIQYW